MKEKEHRMQQQMDEARIFNILEKMGVNRLNVTGEKIQDEVLYIDALLKNVDEYISKETIAIIVASYVFKGEK